MKSKITTLLILILTLGLVPINFSIAISQNHIDAEVQIVCTDGNDNWFSGSGTIIDPKGIILTNRHVIEGAYQNICIVGFIESISQEPNFGTEGNYNLAEVKYYTTTNDMDAAILYLNNPTKKTYPYVNIWNSNSSNLQLGDDIEVIGFPSVGGSTITYTSGDFSGFGSATNGTQNYIKTTAPLEHGNSGGGAYNSSGQFIGIPTMVVAGSLNSISYILSVNSIKNWLSNKLGTGYQNQITEYEPQSVSPNITIQNDITPPQLKDYAIGYSIINDDNAKKSYIQYTIPRDWIVDESGLDKIYYYFGDSGLADPKVVGKSFTPGTQGNITIPEKFLLSGDNELYFIIRLQDTAGNISNSIISPWKVSVMKEVGTSNVLYNEAMAKFTTADTNVVNKYSGYFVKNNNQIWWVSPKEKQRFLIYDPNLSLSFTDETLYDWFNSNWNGMAMSTGITESNFDKSPKNVWGHLLMIFKDDNSGVSDDPRGSNAYINPANGKVTFFNYYKKNEQQIYNTITSLAVDISDSEINKIEPLGKNNLVWQNIQYDLGNNKVPKYYYATTNNSGTNDDVQVDQAISNRLRGYILLQVEANGEAYYVYPGNKKKYYLGRPNDAFAVMRKLGLGATHDFIAGHIVFPDNVLGKILLDVEQNGEAYYIYPKDKKAYYLGRPADAFRIMRELGLGITNSNLSKIPEGNL